MNKLFKFYAVALALFGIEKAHSTNDDDDLKLQANSIALQTPFYLPLKFTTEVGILTLAITNKPEEVDNFYLQPYHLPEPADFFEMSHLAFLREVRKSFEDLETQHAQLLAEIRETGLLPRSLEKKYADETLEKVPLPKSILEQFNKDSTRDRAAIKNIVLPLYLQTYKYHLEDKYAFPYSVLTLDWTFEPTGDNDQYKALKDFADREEFYIYINNEFVEHINKIVDIIYDDMIRKNRRILYS